VREFRAAPQPEIHDFDDMQLKRWILPLVQLVLSVAFITIHISTSNDFDRVADGWAALGNQQSAGSSEETSTEEAFLYIFSLIPIIVIGRKEKGIKNLLKIMSITGFIISLPWLALSSFLWSYGLNPTTPAFILMSAVLWTIAFKRIKRAYQGAAHNVRKRTP